MSALRSTIGKFEAHAEELVRIADGLCTTTGFAERTGPLAERSKDAIAVEMRRLGEQLVKLTELHDAALKVLP